MLVWSLLLGLCLHAQTVEVTRQSSQHFPCNTEGFDMIESRTDTSKLALVATLKATGKNKYTKIQDLFYKIETKAHALGANSYRLHRFQPGDSLQPMVLMLDVYACGNALLDANNSLHEKNVVYVLSNNRSLGSTKFKIDGAKKTLTEATFCKPGN